MLALQHLVVALQPAAPLARVEREAWLMGTRFRVVVEAEDRTSGRLLGETAITEVERIESLLSSWNPTTPLSLINRLPPGVWSEVDPELGGLLAESSFWARRTAGAFEARIGPLIDAWDLRGVGRIPDDRQLGLALAATGGAGVELADGKVRRTSGSAWIDAGAFGKGVALRAAARSISETPPPLRRRVLMDLGGQVLALAPSHAPWTIEVAHPLHRSEAVATLSIHDQSVSTSGTSERGRHILDPRTGRPVDAWGSVTVVDTDALTADVVSTALYVMGPGDGLAWAMREGMAALFLRLIDGSVVATWTPEMDPWLQRAPTPHPSNSPE